MADVQAEAKPAGILNYKPLKTRVHHKDNGREKDLRAPHPGASSMKINEHVNAHSDVELCN